MLCPSYFHRESENLTILQTPEPMKRLGFFFILEILRLH